MKRHFSLALVLLSTLVTLGGAGCYAGTTDTDVDEVQGPDESAEEGGVSEPGLQPTRMMVRCCWREGDQIVCGTCEWPPAG